jgi:regulator of replication initiation timing
MPTTEQLSIKELTNQIDELSQKNQRLITQIADLNKSCLQLETEKDDLKLEIGRLKTIIEGLIGGKNN